MKKHLYM